MIRAGFLTPNDRAALTKLARDGSAAHRLARRANALLLLDGGWSCVEVAEALLLDDDTVRDWHKLYVEGGLAGLARFESGGSASHLSKAQEEAVVDWATKTLPRSTRQIGAHIEKEFGVVYESRSGLIALLHRLGLEYAKPETIGKKLDVEKQKAFIAAYEDLLNSLGPDEAVLSRTPCIPRMRRAPSAAGPRPRRIWRSSRRAGASASTFMARSISRPARPR